MPGFNRRDFIRMAGLGTAALAIPQLIKCGKAADPKPNIVIILIDDMGWMDTGYTGSSYYETPNIDRLASGGMAFSNAYANAPNCAPSRACLMSGQYSPRHGIYTVNSSKRGKSFRRKLIPVENTVILDTNIITIADALKTAGYISASIGKWHIGEGPETGPEGQGFDINIGGNRAGHPKSYFSPYKNKDIKDGEAGEYLTDRLTDDAVNFIESNKDRPFFLYLTHYAVHTPIQSKPELKEKYGKKQGSGGQDNAGYAGMIESVDSGIGRIINKLSGLGLKDNTLIFFFSDNGGLKRITSNEPLRGGKGMLYEGGIRVPMIVSWPDRIKPGTKCDTPVTGIDFFPTILEAAETKPADVRILDGLSLMPLLRGKNSIGREALFWHFPAYLEGKKAEGAKDPWFRTRPGGAVRKGDWKLIEYFEDNSLELYNLKDDISEKNNLAEKMPDKTKELYGVMLNWRKSVNAPVPTQVNPDYDPDRN